MNYLKKIFERIVKKGSVVSTPRVSLAAPTPQEQQAIDTLRDKILSIPPSNPRDTSPATKKWTFFKEELGKKILQDDPRYFMSWDVIKHNMVYQSNAKDTEEVLSYFAEWKLKALVEKEPNENTLLQAFHLMHFEKHTGRKIKDMECIVDLGGGYGSMCRLVHALGFKGKYIIYDWPEFLALQEFYLTLSDVKGDIHFVGDDEKLKELLPDSKHDLLIATWSLSETSPEFRESFMDIVKPQNYLIAYQKEFSGINNHIYFELLKMKLPNVEWIDVPIDYIPHQGNRYLFGIR
jgi:hypothetical protein